MKPVRVSLVTIGLMKYPINLKYIEKWESQIFKIRHDSSIGQLPDCDGEIWNYSDDLLSKVISPCQDSDITVAIISAPIEDNYYMRRLNNNVVVLSLHEMAEILAYNNFKIEDFVIRNIYEIVLIFLASKRTIPTSYHTWAHDDTRGCLFDMNGHKFDIIYSMDNPKLCSACNSKLQAAQIEADVFPALGNELSKIKKSLYFRMFNWVKSHPILSMLITVASALALNIIASILYEIIKKHILHWD